ncbi:MAG TPA: hypothetical protein PKD10_07315 [Paracoccaceae bacterium]|nr:hypothetical protein [Paracoccaceae bacterium]
MAWRSVLSLLLAVLLAMASQSMAVARSHAAAGAFAVEVCADGAPATVLLDSQGKPVPPVHLCPDCVAGLALAMPPGSDPPFRPQALSRAGARSTARATPSTHPPAPPARGPPAFV